MVYVRNDEMALPEEALEYGTAKRALTCDGKQSRYPM